MLRNINRIADKLFYSMTILIVLVLGLLGAVIIHQRVADVSGKMSARTLATTSYLEQVLPRAASRLDAKRMRAAIESAASEELQAVEIFDVDNELTYVYERAGNNVLYDRKMERELVNNDKVVGKMTAYFSIANSVKQMRLREFLRLVIMISAAGLVFGASIYTLAKRIIIRPIETTLLFSKELSGGNYEKRIHVTRNDEMGMLQRSLNSMADAMQETMEHLKSAFFAAEGSRREALEASRLKSEFLANMSHEIRTPLNAIAGFTDILIENESEPEKMETLKTIKKSAEILLENITEVLDFSKIEAGKLKISASEFSLKDLVEEITPIVNLRLYGRDVEFGSYLEEELQAPYSGDRARIRQVLLNLLLNSAKFTHTGRIFLSIGRDDNGGRAVFKIEDTGIGIPKDYREKVFEPFVQADRGITREHGGTGLGLAISKGLVEMMGGSIWIEDKPTEGTIVCFALPMA